MKNKAYEHQERALQARNNCKVSKNGFAFLMDMGTGKSYTLLHCIMDEYESGVIDAAIISAPSQVAQQWNNNQIPDHIDVENKNIKVVLWGANSKKLESQLAALLLHKGLSILIINPEAVVTQRGATYIRAFLAKRKTLIGIDESPCIKNPSAKRTKMFLKFGAMAKKRIIMTGTPITNSPMDAFSQFQFVEPGCLGQSNYVAFRNRYAITKTMHVNGRKFENIVGYQRLDELQERIAAISFRVLKSECIELPPKIYEVREVKMRPKQEKYYLDMKNEMMAFLDSGEIISAPIVLTQLLRLRQASCNIYPSGDNLEYRIIEEEDTRIDEVINVIEESSGKALIWATFTPAVERIASKIAERFGKEKVNFIHGSTSGKDREEIIKNFKFGSLDYLVMNPKTGGSGLDLWQASTVIYYNNDWSLDVRMQSEDRVHRIGQTKSVLYVDIVCKGTIDEKIIDAIKNKKSIALQITGDNLRNILQ